MTHTVTVGEFEGPLGILLELVERNQVEVTAISVADITAQYLARVHELEGHSPEQLSEFLQLGSRLLYIKSLALLPGETVDERAEELRRLNLELEEYRRFQQAARELARRGLTPSWERPVSEQLSIADLPLPNLTLSQLTAAFTQALERTRPVLETAIVPTHLSLEAALARLRERLGSGFLLREALEQCHNQLEVIVTFLALLELVREGAARVVQTSQFAPITVEAYG